MLDVNNEIDHRHWEPGFVHLDWTYLSKPEEETRIFHGNGKLGVSHAYFQTDIEGSICTFYRNVHMCRSAYMCIFCCFVS